MTGVGISFAMFALAGALRAQQPAPPALLLALDTPVTLRLKQAVSSEYASVNERVEFEVAEDVRAEQRVVIPKGSYAWGVITAAERKGRLRRNGRLDIDLEAVCLPDGTPAPLRAVRRGALRGDTAEVTAGDSLFALPALPVMLFVWGQDVTIPEGREFQTFLAEDTPLRLDAAAARPTPIRGRCDKPEPAAAPAPVPQIAQAATREALSAVSVRTNPPGAEIYVDDRFMGNSPATLRLPPGEHRIRLVAPGHAMWERLLATTPGGESNLQVRLESQVLVRKE